MRRIVIAGSTGSIGTQALDVISRSDSLEVVGLAAGSSVDTLLEQAVAHGVERIALADPDAAARAGERWTGGRELAGAEGLVELIVETECDLVLNSLVGSAGLGPTVAALGEGIDLALANKESLVVGGELVMALAEATGARIVPVDSEHTALHQLIAGQPAGSVERMTITASGGPFRGRTRAELGEVTAEQALNHPTWQMGGKITIDSATLMNKGLELIEAHRLFPVGAEAIEIVVHPQSVIHSLVEYVDGSVLAQLGAPDMRVPIAHTLAWPERMETPCQRLDLVAIGALAFEAPDPARFPALRLAREALAAGGAKPAILNAANEIAVASFLERRLGFLDIASLVGEVLARFDPPAPTSIDAVLEIDGEARRVAAALTGKIHA